MNTDRDDGLVVVIPVLNDALALARLLPRLRELLALPHCLRTIVVVDGGSDDDPAALLHSGEQLVESSLGRGQQLAAATEGRASGWIWMLHADSDVSKPVVDALLRFVAGDPAWGRFDVSVDGLPLISAFMNNRSALTGICTGDQGIVVHAKLLRAVGGVPAQPLMEDIELSRRLKRLQAPTRLSATIGTSARRWRSRGVLRCVLQMWWFRLRYFLGADPAELAAEYYARPLTQELQQ